MTTTDYASKISGLLAKAESTDSPEEAKALTAKAEELMVKWGVDDAMLAEKRRKQKKGNEKIVEKQIRISGPMCRGEVHLGFAVGEGLGLKVLKSNGLPGEGTMVQYVYLIGHESDVQRGETLLASLLLQSKLARAAWWKGYERKGELTNNQAFLAKRQFVISFSVEVHKRLTETRHQVHEQVGAGTELVLVNRASAVDEWMEANYPKLRKGQSINLGNGDSHVAGTKAGREANLGGNEVDSSKAAQVGA